MLKYLFTFIIIQVSFISTYAQTVPIAYKIYDAQGKEVKWKNFIKDIATDKDVVLFGELHDNMIGHWIQYETAKTLIDGNDNWILGAEMMEFDQQDIIDEYLSGYIVQSAFEEDTRLWSNYSDYKPLLELAKENNRNFVASNIPRRYARTVFYNDLDTLQHIAEKHEAYMPSLPIRIDTTLKSYADLRQGMNMHGSATMYLMEAQAIKDAVMAHNICVNLKDKNKMIHFNGAYHSDSYEGINVYLREYCNPKIITISMAVTENCTFPEKSKNIANYIIVTNKNL